jgi:RNA polymerase sigma-70 factor (ECF subfamily)
MDMADPITRSSLLIRLKDADDIAAWEEFSQLYGQVIYRVALTAGFQAVDAEDLVQEVFLSVSLSLNQWLTREDRGKFRAWLIRIARNEAIDRMRQRTKKSLGQGGSVAEQLLAQLPDRADFSVSLDLEYQRTLFRWAAMRVKQEVTEQVWQAFWMTSIEAVPINQADENIQTTVGNIYVARSRVIARIKNHIVNRGEQE